KGHVHFPRKDEARLTSPKEHLVSTTMVAIRIRLELFARGAMNARYQRSTSGHCLIALAAPLLTSPHLWTRVSASLWRSNCVIWKPRSVRGPKTLCVSSGPSQDRLDRSDAWIFRLTDYSEQLEPALVICLLHEVANNAGGKIGYGHRRRSGALLDPGGNGRVQRHEHRSGDVRTIEISNKIAEHDPPCRIRLGALTVTRLL